MSIGPIHCYIYYRIDPERAAAAHRTIAAVFSTIEQRAGVTGSLLQRQDEPMLWMEVYENVHDPERFEVMLADLLDTHRFSQFLAPDSARRIERFVANTGAG